MARRPKAPGDLKDPKNAMIVKLVEQVQAEVIKRYGTKLTYEERRDASVKVMAEVMWADAEKDLKQQVTDEEEVEIDGRRYRRLGQPSSAVYYGRWGPHEIEESLYRVRIPPDSISRSGRIRSGFGAKRRVRGWSGCAASDGQVRGVERGVAHLAFVFSDVAEGASHRLALRGWSTRAL